MGKPELAIPDLSLVLKLNPDHVNAAFARAACYNSMGLLTQAIEDYNFALFKDQTLNSPAREDTSVPGSTRNRTWSGASSSIMDLPFTPKGKDSFSIGFSPASSIAGTEPSSSTKRLDVDATGIFSLYGVASPTLGSGRQNLRAMTPSSDVFAIDAYSGDSPRPGSALSGFSMSSSAVNMNSARNLSASSAGSTSTFKSLTQFRSQQQQKEDETNCSNAAQADKHHATAYELRKQGNYSGAIEEYTQALSFDSRHFKSLFNRGFAYDKLGQYGQAIQDYSIAIDINPEYAFCFYNRGITYDHMGDLQSALADFSKAISLQSNNADFYHNRAYVYRKLQQWSEAVEDYTKILKFSSNNFKALFNRSLCYERTEQIKEALDDIELALQLQPQHGGCYAHRGIVFEKLEQHDRALADFSTALSYGAQSFPCLSSRARVYSKMGNNDLAVNDLTACLEVHPEDLPTLFSRATCYKSLQKWREAIADFSKVLSLLQSLLTKDSDFATDVSVIVAQQVLAFNQRGYCFRKMDLVEDAIRDYGEAIRLSPEQIRAYNNRGFLFAKCNRFEEAISDYTKAIQLDPHNAYAYHNRGISYDKLGLIDQAIADFGRVFELDSKQSLLVNSGGNMNSMTSIMIPSTSKLERNLSSGQDTVSESTESVNFNSMNNTILGNLRPTIGNESTAAAPLGKFSLRQQVRSRTPTNVGMQPSSSLLMPVESRPPFFPPSAPSTHQQSTIAEAGKSSSPPSISLRSTSPSIIKRRSLAAAPRPVSSPEQIITSESVPVETSTNIKPHSVTFALDESPQSATSSFRHTIGSNKNKSGLSISRPIEDTTEKTKLSPTNISAAELDEKLDTVASLLSKFGRTSSDNTPEVVSAPSFRPSKQSLVIQPKPVGSSDNDQPGYDYSERDDDRTSPKPFLSQGMTAAQKFGVQLRSTSSLTTSKVASQSSNTENNQNIVRPRFLSEPVAANNETEIASKSSVNPVSSSITAPIQAATFLAKLRESRQEEAQKLRAQRDTETRAASSSTFLKSTFSPRQESSSHSDSSNGKSEGSILSRPPGKFSQLHS
jgi:tetratricopeptide (TPR) repeat protein